MKGNNYKFQNILFSVMSLVALFLGACNSQYSNVTEDPLEQRLDTILDAMSMQEKIEQLYYNTDGNERFGIPQFTGSDGPHGIGNGAKGYSSFPVTIGMAASWDTDLITRVGRAIALEQAARGRDRIAGPTLDLLLEPRIGRAPETIGEDPYLGGRISEAFVLGQNTTSVFGTIKHYNLNTYELNRRTNNYLSDERSLVEFWGYHWKRTIQAGGALSVMCAYNWVNGYKCAENSFLIKDVLRDHWGFNYYTMCDWGGFSDTGKALKSKLDFCEGNDLYIKELPDGVKSGKFDSTLVERAARNVLRTKLVSGMIDGKPETSKNVIDSKEHRELVYESGLKSLVLLKNDKEILPFNKNLNSVAVIGPNAAVLPLDGHSSSQVLPSYRIPVLDAIQTLIGKKKVTYSKGCNINDKSKKYFDEAKAAAKNAEYVVFVAGLDSTLEGEGWFLDPEADQEGGGIVTRPDRATGTVVLPEIQVELINELAGVNPNMVLVVISGGTCSVTPVIENVQGLLYAFYPGQEAGRAIADVLFCDYNPSGKLPATIPKDDSQIRPITPDFRNMVNGGAGYRWFDAEKQEPEFAFGSGISYTTFEYSNIQVNNKNAKVGDFIDVSFNVKNTGQVAGEEVAQLYLSTGKISPNLSMPKKQLRGFKKMHLNPGESKNVVVTLTPEDFYVYNEENNSYQVPEGEYSVKIGGASDNLPLEINFDLSEADGKPDLSLVNIRTVPAFPKEGDEVLFLVSVINNGTGVTKLGDSHIVEFAVNGENVAYYHSKKLVIPVGGMEVICAQGIKHKNWKAQEGKFRISANILTNGNEELNLNNNSCEGRLTIPDGKVLPMEISNLIN